MSKMYGAAFDANRSLDLLRVVRRMHSRSLWFSLFQSDVQPEEGDWIMLVKNFAGRDGKQLTVALPYNGHRA